MTTTTTADGNGRFRRDPAARWERRRARLVARQSAATTPAHRLAAAYDYLRAALTDAAVDQAARHRVAALAADALADLADRLAAAAHGGRPGGGHRA